MVEFHFFVHIEIIAVLVTLNTFNVVLSLQNLKNVHIVYNCMTDFF